MMSASLRFPSATKPLAAIACMCLQISLQDSTPASLPGHAVRALRLSVAGGSSRRRGAETERFHVPEVNGNGATRKELMHNENGAWGKCQKFDKPALFSRYAAPTARSSGRASTSSAGSSFHLPTVTSNGVSRETLMHNNDSWGDCQKFREPALFSTQASQHRARAASRTRAGRRVLQSTPTSGHSTSTTSFRRL